MRIILKKKKNDNPEKKNKSKKVFLALIVIGIVSLRFVESATPCLEYGRVFYNLGLESEGRSHWQKALGYYKKAIGYNPGLVEAYNNIASVYQISHDFDTSIQFAQKAINLDAKYHQAYHTLGLAYRAKGYFALALKSFLTAYKLYRHSPCIPIYLYDVGIAYNDVGDQVNSNRYLVQLRSLNEINLADELEINRMYRYDPLYIYDLGQTYRDIDSQAFSIHWVDKLRLMKEGKLAKLLEAKRENHYNPLTLYEVGVIYNNSVAQNEIRHWLARPLRFIKKDKLSGQLDRIIQ